jgi:hypothetical protein
VPNQWRLASVAPHIVAKKPRNQSIDTLKGALSFLRVEGVVQIDCQQGLAGVEGTLCTFGPDLTAKGNADSKLDWLHRGADQGALYVYGRASCKAVEDFWQAEGP